MEPGIKAGSTTGVEESTATYAPQLTRPLVFSMARALLATVCLFSLLAAASSFTLDREDNVRT